MITLSVCVCTDTSKHANWIVAGGQIACTSWTRPLFWNAGINGLMAFVNALLLQWQRVLLCMRFLWDILWASCTWMFVPTELFSCVRMARCAFCHLSTDVSVSSGNRKQYDINVANSSQLVSQHKPLYNQPAKVMRERRFSSPHLQNRSI